MGRMERIKPVTLPRLLKKPGMHGDGGGLFLKVKETGSAAWVLKFTLDRRAREMGLGPFNAVSLVKAREAARAARELISEGLDPIEHRRLEKAKKRAEAAKALSFRQCAEAYIASHREGWRNPKHAAQWASTLETYAYP